MSTGRRTVTTPVDLAAVTDADLSASLPRLSELGRTYSGDQRAEVMGWVDDVIDEMQRRSNALTPLRGHGD